MKALKKIFIFLLVLVVALAIGSQFLPSSFRVERNVLIKTGADRIFPFINDLRVWPEWSVCNTNADPTLVFTYEGPTEGVGAISRWEGKKFSTGSMTITESDPAKGIKLDMIMGKIKPIKCWVTFAPAGTDTKVIFGCGGELSRNPLERWMALFMDIFAGPEFEKSLVALRKMVEAQPK